MSKLKFALQMLQLAQMIFESFPDFLVFLIQFLVFRGVRGIRLIGFSETTSHFVLRFQGGRIDASSNGAKHPGAECTGLF